MPLTERDYQKRFDAKQSQMLNTVSVCRHLAPAALAAQDRLNESLARSAILASTPYAFDRRPSALRRWLGSSVVRLGAWLGGIDLPSSNLGETATRSA